MNSAYEWIVAICAIIGCFSVFAAFITICLGYKKEKDHYDSYRRLNTINFMNDWNHHLQDKVQKAEKIVRTLTDAQCRKLYKLEPVELDLNTFKNVCQMCSRNNGSCKDCIVPKKGGAPEKYIIQGTPVSELRGYTISYLNNLEILMLAWKLDIVEQDAISKQFKCLYNPSNDRNALKRFRDVAGDGLAYPMIDVFVKDLEEKSKASVEANDGSKLGEIRVLKKKEKAKSKAK